ncbi:OmpA/MotB family protein [Clostridium grantii]|uniref:Chemotaxis protein MotB n=1 Tax=Clostridium grantii DSM 8605 TaxID=1121316 RepID=A0A1M5XJ44_9CLOT|nr:flagellar motor protein MotB [Clostridium grantii]SHH99830.1 chemotaxis protein MotB [Clostridium grantii DSM 8605]
MRKKKSTEGGGSPLWMTTFSDLMTLLLTFFILLYSISSVDENKFTDVANGLRSILTDSGASVIQEDTNPENREDDILTEESPPDGIEEEVLNDQVVTDKEAIEQLSKEIKAYVAEKELEGSVEVNITSMGILIDIKDYLFFETGKADLREESLGILNTLGQKLKNMPNEIMVEGHTDNIPISTYEFKSNWELSASRAITVVRYFSETQGIDPSRLSAVGHGEYKPKVSNDSSENRQLNRRVNIVVKYLNEENIEE